MDKCVIASDSFKGTLSSKEITDLFEIEFKKVFPHAELAKVVLGDGGENTLEVFANNFPHGKYHIVKVTGPNFQKIKAKYYTYDDTAVIELAEASGLSLATDKNPLKTTTYGVGELIKDAYKNGYRKFYVALGGSSTNDGGCGLLSSLGIKFLNENNQVFIPTGNTISNIKDIGVSDLCVNDAKFTILSDVTNPMYGEKGAAFVFARQKGASDEDIVLLDKNLKYLNELFIRTAGKDVSSVPGSGAAGATSSGMLAFLNAEIVSGINTILDLIDFNSIIKDADYVFTGEGKLDNQSFDGKLISGVLTRTKKQNIKTICVCGINDLKDTSNNPFYKVYETNSLRIPFDEIKKNPAKYYQECIRKVLKEYRK